MTGEPDTGAEDPRLAAARYRIDRELRDAGLAGASEPDARPTASRSGGTSAAERAAFVETAIQQAIRRGEFDDLPGAGKPLEGLGDRYDPDWWLRRKIEREQLRGLGPPALRLRVEDAELDERLDALHREIEVREVLADFNARVREARMQLLGGPPVVTPLRDVEREVSRWRARAEERRAERERVAAAAAASAPRRRLLFRRRRRTEPPPP